LPGGAFPLHLGGGAMDPSDGSPFPGLSFAGPLDDLQDHALAITMRWNWRGYLNVRVLGELNQRFAGRIRYMRFLPEPERGLVIIIPTCDSREYGAIPVDYEARGSGAMVSLRRAVMPFGLTRQCDRNYVFPVKTRTAPDGRVFLAFQVPDAETRPVRRRLEP